MKDKELKSPDNRSWLADKIVAQYYVIYLMIDNISRIEKFLGFRI